MSLEPSPRKCGWLSFPLCGSSIILIILFLSFAASANSKGATNKASDTEKEVEFFWGVRIAMRDGIKLNATLYKPKQMEAPLPVIFALTPYTADNYHRRALYFAENGYVFVVVDCRGRGNSEGQFEPYANDGRDGYDVVEWLARQPWSNGQIAMWGSSYLGYDQWATLKEFPPHLKTIVPTAAVSPAFGFPMIKNIFTTYSMRWLTATSGVTFNANIYGDFHFWVEKYRSLYIKRLPFRDFDKVVGNPSTYFQQWLDHPTLDAYWEAKLPTPEQYRQVKLPILTITGYYDDAQQGAMSYYQIHMRYASTEARANHYLVIGPWDHDGTISPAREVGGAKFGEASVLDMNKLYKEWYDWTLKGGKKPEFLKNRVAYYVTGSEEWKYADRLETISNTKQTFYLHSDGRANDAFQSGMLKEERPTQSQPDKYAYDPLDIRHAEVEREPVNGYLTDQRYALNLFGNGLVYHSEPLVKDMVISGHLRFVAWIAMDVPDTDFQLSVYEVTPDGSSLLLAYDLMRARYRESLEQEKLVRPGELNRYEFDMIQFFSRRVAKGNRLRLILTTPNPIYFEKNYNSDGAVSEESGKDARTAHITIYHDEKHPSFLEIPTGGN